MYFFFFVVRDACFQHLFTTILIPFPLTLCSLSFPTTKTCLPKNKNHQQNGKRAILIASDNGQVEVHMHAVMVNLKE